MQCTCCSKKCTIHNSHYGVCGTRVNNNGILYSTVYGHPSAVQIDPIEKKPLYHFHPGSSVFSIGTVGCNFHCSFCQNWQLSQRPNSHQRQFISPEQIVQTALLEGCACIAFTYNEPTIWGEYVHDIARLAKANNLSTTFITNGSMSEEFIEYAHSFIDAVNVDLKSFNPLFYKKICNGDLNTVLRNINTLYKHGIWLEITTLVIPEENDSGNELKEIASFIASISKSIPWHVTAFHPDFRMIDKSRTSYNSLKRAYVEGKKAGLDFVYMGNLQNTQYENTYCPHCKKLLIERDGMRVKSSSFSGICNYCGKVIPGVWKKVL